MTARPRVLSAMSGGVDSAVATALLVERGMDVTAVTFRTHCYSDAQRDERKSVPCCSMQALDDVRRVCGQLGVHHHVIDVSDEFDEKVVDLFCREYLSGRTPNPCVACNQHIKFGRLFHLARALDASHLATGHYARVRPGIEGRNRLLRGRDEERDQSYVLWPLTQEALGMVLFPLGELTKDEVRGEARRFGLPVAEKEASQEICFVARDYRRFIEARLESRAGGTPPAFRPGDVVDEEGRVIGSHDGVARYTLGQRKGLPARGEPRYVTALDPERGLVHTGRDDALWHHTVVVGELNRIGWEHLPERARADVQIRSHHRRAPAAVRALGEDVIEVEFDDPQRAPSPGQSVVLYRGEEVLAGGVLRSLGSPAAADPGGFALTGRRSAP